MGLLLIINTPLVIRARYLCDSLYRSLLSLIILAKRGKGNKHQENSKTDDGTPANRHASMTWAQRLKRVFNIDISICDACGGVVKVIASIEDPVVIKQILAHLERKAESKEFNPLPESRAPPQGRLFG